MSQGSSALKGLLVALTLVVGCNDTGPGRPGDGMNNDPRCTLNPTAEGCPCDAIDQATCYSDPEALGGSMVCHEGVRTCGADGAWGGCDSIRSFTLDNLEWTAALITPPTECNPCDPNCSIATDYPDDTDLDDTNSFGVQYDPLAGGVTLLQCNNLSGSTLVYTFDAGDSGALVRDRAPAVPNVDLTSTDNTNITFGATSVSFSGAATPQRLEASVADSNALGAALIAANSFSAEVWIETANFTQTGPNRIFTYSNGGSHRAWTIGQSAGNIIVRLRTTRDPADLNGTGLILSAPAFPTTGPLHVVTTYDGTTGAHRLYLDGLLVAENIHLDAMLNPASISNWSPTGTGDFQLAIGDEINADRRWQGTVHHAAVYDRALAADEVACKTTATEDPLESLIDTDGDGVPDVADDCPGDPDFRTVCGDATDDGFYHTLPFAGGAEYDPIVVSTSLPRADIYILMDTSASMGGEINNLVSVLTAGDIDPALNCATGTQGVLGEILCVVPEAEFGLGMSREYPVEPTYGHTDELVYHHMLDMTNDFAAAQFAVDSLDINGNQDTPEGQSQALYALASGNGLGEFIPNRGPCPDGTDWGYACFEDGVQAITIMFTDAPFHNGPTGLPYDATANSPSTALPEAIAALDHDTFGTALNLGDITAQAVAINGSNFNHNDDVNDGCSANMADSMFRFTLNSAQTVTLTTVGSDHDTSLALHDAVPTFLECDHDWVMAPLYGKVSGITRALAAGDYYAVVDGHSLTGAYRLNITNGGATGSMTTASPVSYAQTVAAMNARNMKLITIDSCADPMNANCTDLTFDANTIGTDTNSVDGAGTPYVYPINADGTGLGPAVVQAVNDLVNNSRVDITLVAIDNPATPGVDETQFVKSVTLTNCPVACVPGPIGNVCSGCAYGQNVDYEVMVANDFVPPAMAPQVFDFELHVLADGATILDIVPVRIVVPPDQPVWPPSGTYTNVYDANDRCTIPPERPDWGDFTWTASTPSDSTITFRFRTADDLAGLGTATPVSFTIPTSGMTPPVDVGDLLTMAGEQNLLPYLQVTAELTISTDLLTTPILNGWEIVFTCDAAE